ncbi:phage tail tape measure protein [Avibacterium paragallinarum]|uniref:phage tail tape measure protein n=1 Tax=Avibacterium paragallinarum TaxID=728 RepID=UPI000614B50C|nr:phage tail tape measure protein [Avibacterium paragallinarum]KAA6209026.1 phage tail tape measure protein [Avibacterium paragallinarum]KKA98270.1 hypothetical protein Z012_12290 [Avibacterium paragallinarum]RZN71693.1 phage tail tape measure protein [Avibacterium paragallinarum]
MANNLAIGMVIGAALSSGFKSTFSSARKSLENLGNAISKSQQSHQKLGAELGELRQKQAQLYAEMSKASRKGGTGLALLRADYDKLTNKITAVKRKQQEYTKAIEQSFKIQSKLTNSIHLQEKNHAFRERQKSTFSSNLMAGTAMAATGFGVMKTFMEQEDAATDLKIAMMKMDGSVGAFNEISKIAKELGRDLPGTTKDFYRLAQALKKQGISDSVLKGGALKTSAELNVLLEMDQQAGGEFLAKFMESHRLSESELPQAADYLQRAMYAGGLSKEQMYESMKYYAPKLNSMKLTGAENTEKILAIEAMAGQQGLEGSTFGTGLNMMLSRMNKGPEMLRMATKGMKAEARDIMEASGVEFNFWDKNGAFKGVDGMLAEMQKFEQIRTKFGDKGVGLVAEELFGIEGGRLADILAQKGAKGLDEMLIKMREQASLQDRIKLKTSTLSAALESLGGVWDAAVGSLGAVFGQDIKNWANSLQEAIEKYTPLIAQNKELIKTVVGGVAGFIGFKLALSGLGIIASSVLSPVLSLIVGIRKFKTLVAMLRLKQVTGELTAFGKGAKYTARLLKSMKSGAIRTFTASWRGLKTISSGVVWGMRWLLSGFSSLGKLLGGGLLRGVNVIGKAFLWLGRAMLMNPIGLIITGIALGAFLIYQYWEPISAWFSEKWTVVSGIFSNAWNGISQYCSQTWESIKTFFSSGIGNITASILSWSPLALFQQVFSTVLSWFGIDIPNQFTNFGKNMIDGLVNGIRNAWEGAKEIVSELGNGIKGWFAEKLGIHSPSRVFKGYGVNVVEGLAIGMANAQPLATEASKNLSSAVKFEPVLNNVETVFKPLLSEKKGFFGTLWDDIKFGANFIGNLLGINQPIYFRTPDFNPASGQNSSILRDYQPINRNVVTSNESNHNNGIVVNFNPTINVSATQSQDMLEQVQQGLNMSLVEFERLLNRVLDQRQRRAY